MRQVLAFCYSWNNLAESVTEQRSVYAPPGEGNLTEPVRSLSPSAWTFTQAYLFVLFKSSYVLLSDCKTSLAHWLVSCKAHLFTFSAWQRKRISFSIIKGHKQLSCPEHHCTATLNQVKVSEVSKRCILPEYFCIGKSWLIWLFLLLFSSYRLQKDTKAEKSSKVI